MRKKLMLWVVLVCLAVSAQAAEPFVALVDEERGLLLIPDGSAVPMGVDFALTPEADAPQRFVYAYAAPERFAEARKRIAENEAKFPQPSAEMVLADAAAKKAVGMHAGAARFGRIAANIANFDQTYYYYFWDGSYHAVRKIIYNQGGGGGWVQYTGYGYVYSAAGDWDTKAVVTNSCPTHSYWNQNKTCWFYNADGDCTPAVWTYGTTEPLTATVTSYAVLTRYLYPPCDLPCKSNSSSTMSVSFP